MRHQTKARSLSRKITLDGLLAVGFALLAAYAWFSQPVWLAVLLTVNSLLYTVNVGVSLRLAYWTNQLQMAKAKLAAFDAQLADLGVDRSDPT